MSERQQAAIDERTANRLRSNAELSEFVDAITPAVRASDPEAFWACEQPLARLLRSPFLRLFVRNELRRIAEDPAYIPAPGLSPAEFTVAAGNDYSLTIQLLEPGVSLSKKLYSSTVHCLIGAPELPGTAGPTYAWHEQTAPWPNEVFDRSRVLTPTGIRTFAPGEVYRIRAGIDVSRLLPPQQTVILLFLGSRNVLPLRWEYDDKLRPVRAMAATPTASRFEFTARMLAEFGDRESLEPLGELAEHPDHFVRWAAVRAVMRIDFAAGLHLLHAAEEDRHPHVRRAAKRALENLERQGRLASRQPGRALA